MTTIAGGILLALLILVLAGGLASLCGSALGDVLSGLVEGIRSLTPSGRREKQELAAYYEWRKTHPQDAARFRDDE